ncbi:MAG: DinB family protein [Thermoplasmata archaeon]
MPVSDPEFRTDLERILVYHRWARNKYLDLFERLPWRVLTRKRAATFESIRNVHLHVMAVYATWLARFFTQRKLRPVLAQLQEPRWKRIRSVRQMREIDRKVDAAVQAVSRQLRPDRLDRKRLFQLRSGKYPVTAREVLWHLVEEDFLHHGEILCMLWQDDIEPPYTGVWWFEYDHNPLAHQDMPWTDPKYPRPSAGGYVTKRPATTRAAATGRRKRRYLSTAHPVGGSRPRPGTAFVGLRPGS